MLKHKFNSPVGKSQQNNANFQNGFILLPVVLAITLVAAIAFLMNREGAMAVNELAGEMQTSQASLAAKAGISHMLWRVTNANCAGYANLAAASMGNNSYNATISPANNTPVSIKATGTDANGASVTINRDRVTMYKPYETVTLQLGTEPGMDAYISSTFSTTNYGIGANSVLKENIFGWRYRNQLLYFDLPSSIPMNAHIVSAQLLLYQNSGNSKGDVSVHKLTRGWVEGTKNGSGTADGVNWKTYDGTNAWTTNGGDYIATPVTTSSITSDGDTTKSWEIAPLVQDWLASPSTNYGMLMKTDDSISPTFASKEDTTPSKRPKLIITYTCECGKICAPAKKIYWTDDTANKIQMSDEDGSHVEDLITSLDRPTGLDIDDVNGKLYWTNNKEIRRSNLDGTNAQTIYSGSLVTMDIKLDVTGGKMYWTHDNPTSLVMRANLDGSASQTINTTLNRPAYLSVNTSAGQLYLTNFGNGTVSRMNLDGTSVTNLVSTQGSPLGSAVDPINGKVYWSSGSTGKWLRRANLDGGSIESIVTGLSDPQDIVYDADSNRIYWTDMAAKKVQRANQDGSSLTNVVTSGLTHPRGIALVNAQLVGNNRSKTLISVADADIYQGLPNNAFGSEIDIVTGKDTTGKDDKILIKFDVSSIPVGATVTSATLRLNLIGTSGSGSYNIGVYKIIASWSEATAKWSNFSASSNYNTTRLAVTSVALGTTGVKEWTLPVGLINEWTDGVPTPNYGMALVYEGTTKGPDYQFASKENMTVASRPQLVINYTLP